MIQKWKTVKSETLFNDLWFKVRKDTCVTENGKTIDPYYVYEFPTWVTAFALTKDGKVIMEKQYRHGLQEIAWEIPGGCVDDTDASLEDAVKRELLEETGYAFDEFIYLGSTCANPSTNNNLMHMYLATGGEKIANQSLDPNEEIEVKLFSMEEMKKMWLENNFNQAMHYTCITQAFLHLGVINFK